MNLKAWLAVAIVGFTIGAGINGLVMALDDGEEPAPTTIGTPDDGVRPGATLQNGEFQIPAEGEFELPEGPVTLPDGTVIDVEGGQITMPDGSVIEAPALPATAVPRPRQAP